MASIDQFAQALEEVTEERLGRARMAVSAAVALFDGELEATGIAAAIPLLYAHWEGYVRESIQLYLDYIEQCNMRFRDLDLAALAFAWDSELRKLSGGHNHAKAAAFLLFGSSNWSKPVKFGDIERAVDLKSNAGSKVIASLANQLCVDLQSIQAMGAHLDDFVEVRNRIGHGKTFKVNRKNLFMYAQLMRQLVLLFEAALLAAVSSRSFCIVKSA